MTCALYMRVSKETCKECGKTRRKCDCLEFTGQDPENQAFELRSFAIAMGWSVAAEYVDFVSAGGKKERPQFTELFAAAKRKEFDVVVFWALDRFSREGAIKTLNLLQELTDHGVRWRSFKEQYLDSTGIFREAVIAILAVVAKQERIRISERTIAGLAQAKRDGKTLGKRRMPVDMERLQELRAEGASGRAIATAMGLRRTMVSDRIKELA